MISGGKIIRFGACAALLATHFASAADFAYQAEAGLGHSDNVTRSASVEESESIATAGLGLSLSQDSARLQADVLGNFAYYDYLDDTYDSEVLGNFAGNARYAFVPERFEWMASDNFGQVLNDPVQAATPDNRENINNFSTGPDAMLAFGSQTRLRLGGRYSLTTYERSALDSDTVSANLALIRLLSSASSGSVNFQTAKISYDDTAFDADYRQSEAFLRYDVSGARTFLAVDAGYTQLERDATADKEDGLLLRLDAARRLSSASTATLNAGREFANSATAFTAAQNTAPIGVGTAPGRQTALPFTRDHASLGWSFARNRTGLSFGAGWERQSYEDVGNLDQTLYSGTMAAHRDMSQSTSLLLNVLYSHAKFDQIGGDYRDLEGGLTFRWRWSQSLSMNLSYEYYDRSSDAPAGDFNENRIWLTFAYGKGTVNNMVGPQFAVDRGI